MNNLWKTISGIASIIAVFLTIYSMHRSGVERLAKVETKVDNVETDVGWLKQAFIDNGVIPKAERQKVESMTARNP